MVASTPFCDLFFVNRKTQSRLDETLVYAIVVSRLGVYFYEQKHVLRLESEGCLVDLVDLAERREERGEWREERGERREECSVGRHLARQFGVAYAGQVI